MPAPHPWFPFNIDLWRRQTSTLSAQQKGAYMDLLVYAWEHGSIPADLVVMARIARIYSRREWERLWTGIAPLWRLLPGGGALVSDDLETIRQRAQRKSFAASINATKRWRGERGRA